MSGEIVPFGKYRDKPLQDLVADREYVDWLMMQPWFRDRYVNIYNLVVNGGTELVESPEHNKIQLLFLDKKFATKVYNTRRPKLITMEEEIQIVFEHSSKGTNGFPIDVVLNRHQNPVAIEIKPSVGDDYPVVLRQMKKSRANTLLISQYDGEAEREKFVALFQNEGIMVLFLEDLLKE